MSHQAQPQDRLRGEDGRRKNGMHVSAQDARQADVVLDTPRKRWLIVGIFLIGVIALGALIFYYA